MLRKVFFLLTLLLFSNQVFASSLEKLSPSYTFRKNQTHSVQHESLPFNSFENSYSPERKKRRIEQDYSRVYAGLTPLGLATHAPMTTCIYVANGGSNTVSLITNGERTKDIEVGQCPTALAILKDTIYVVNSMSNTVSLVPLQI